MAKWVSDKIDIYFNDITGDKGENCLPFLPESFTTKIQGKNEEIDMLTIGTVNLLKTPALKTWQIDCVFESQENGVFETERKSDKWSPELWVDFFESAMSERKVLEMTVTGLNYIVEVTVENFEHKKTAGEELDTYYVIDLKEYKRYEIKEQEVKIEQSFPLPEVVSPIKVEGDGMGNIAWLKGFMYRRKGETKLEQPLPYFYNDGAKVKEQQAHFDWLKVKKQTPDTLDVPKRRLTFLAQHILNSIPQNDPKNPGYGTALFDVLELQVSSANMYAGARKINIYGRNVTVLHGPDGVFTKALKDFFKKVYIEKRGEFTLNKKNITPIMNCAYAAYCYDQGKSYDFKMKDFEELYVLGDAIANSYVNWIIKIESINMQMYVRAYYQALKGIFFNERDIKRKELFEILTEAFCDLPSIRMGKIPKESKYSSILRMLYENVSAILSAIIELLMSWKLPDSWKVVSTTDIKMFMELAERVYGNYSFTDIENPGIWQISTEEEFKLKDTLNYYNSSSKEDYDVGITTDTTLHEKGETYWCYAKDLMPENPTPIPLSIDHQIDETNFSETYVLSEDDIETIKNNKQLDDNARWTEYEKTLN